MVDAHNKDQSFPTDHGSVQSLRCCRSTVVVEPGGAEDLRKGLEVDYETWLLELCQRQRESKATIISRREHCLDDDRERSGL